MAVRFASKDDIEAIAEIERECFSAPWSKEALLSELENTSCVMLVAEDKEIVGYVSMRCVLDEGYINNIAVTESCRRRGIAKSLLDSLADIGKEKGLAFITLEVRESNAAARSLYISCDYTQTGVRRSFYRMPREDALLYTIFLKSGAKN